MRDIPSKPFRLGRTLFYFFTSMKKLKIGQGIRTIVGSYVNFSGKVREVRSIFFVRLKLSCYERSILAKKTFLTSF